MVLVIEVISSELDVFIFIDIMKVEVMCAVVVVGVGLINDVNVLRGEGAL